MSEGEELEAVADRDDVALSQAVASLMVIAGELRGLADQVVDLNNQPLEPAAFNNEPIRFDRGITS